MTERLPMETRLNRNDLSWIGRAGCIFFHKGFVVRSLRAHDRPAPRSRLVLRKNPLSHHFPPN
jgi:hypothetical protein